MSVRNKFLALRDELRTVVFERESAIDNALLALLSREHFLQLGPPGVAKSMLVDQLCSRITGAQQFSLLLTGATTLDEVLGPPDIIAMAEESRYTRRRTASISEAHIAFLDEVYKSNGVVLNALYNIINERIVKEIGLGTMSVPLISLFAASNEGPEEQAMKIFDDRFALREVVQDLTDDDNFMRLLLSRPTIPQAFLSLDDLVAGQQEIQQVGGSAEALEVYVALRHALQHEGIAVSTRRWTHSVNIVRARAWLDGLPSFDVESLTCLEHVLWSDPKDRPAVRRLVYQQACPLALKAVEMEDNALAVYKTLPSELDSDFKGMADAVLVQLTDQHKILEQEITRSHARDKSRAVQGLHTISKLHDQLCQSLLGRIQRQKLSR